MNAQLHQRGFAAPQGYWLCRWLGPHVALVSRDGQYAVLKLAEDAAHRALIEKEARILSRLDGLGVAPRLLGQGDRGRHSWLLLEYLEGHHPEPPLVDTDRAAIERAIHATHRQMVIHCDLKPSNIVLRNERAWLIDWSLAATPGQPITDMPHRPYSSGWTHPDLIWGHGYLSPKHDLHVLTRLQDTSWHEKQTGYAG